MSDKPVYSACFESLANPSERYELDEVVYTDSQGGLLQVAHDMDELKKTSADEWKALFQDRGHKNEWPYGSAQKRLLWPSYIDTMFSLSMPGSTHSFFPHTPEP